MFDELCVSTTSARARAVYTTPHSQHTDHHAVHALQLGKSVVCAVIDNSRQRGVARAAAEDDEEDDVMQPAAARDMASDAAPNNPVDAPPTPTSLSGAPQHAIVTDCNDDDDDDDYDHDDKLAPPTPTPAPTPTTPAAKSAATRAHAAAATTHEAEEYFDKDNRVCLL